jgi:hypothetical protein
MKVMLPFNLDAALSGAKVCTTEGVEVTTITYNPKILSYPVRVRIADDTHSYTADGVYNRSHETRLDLCLYEEL